MAVSYEQGTNNETFDRVEKKELVFFNMAFSTAPGTQDVLLNLYSMNELMNEWNG